MGDVPPELSSYAAAGVKSMWLVNHYHPTGNEEKRLS
jgi:hypothetical protein